jgi:3-methyladenine DNA glycosylase Mpg
VALSLTSLLGVRAPGYSCRKSTIVDMSAGAAAGGAACTSVGARSMRNYLKFGAGSLYLYLYTIYLFICYRKEGM